MLNSLLLNGYVVQDELTHAEIIPFVQKHLRRVTPSTIAYIFANFLLLFAIGYAFFAAPTPIEDALAKFGLGVFLTIALIPLHELLHGLAYKALGAAKVSYKADIKSFVFYAIADKHVLHARHFRMVAICPFVVITTVLAVSCFFVSDKNLFILLGMLMLHTGACSGDFGLMSYFDQHQGKGMITFDDSEIGASYFLIKPR